MKIFKNPIEEKKVPIFKTPTPPNPVEERLLDVMTRNAEKFLKEEPKFIQEVAPPPTPPAVEPMGTIPHIPVTPALPEILQRSELTGIHKQISDIAQRVNSLAFGGGGTGAVRFDALDDHQYPRDVNSLTFNTPGTPDPSPDPGTLSWNPSEDCLNVYQADGTVLQAGLEQYIRVHNMTGSTIINGDLVYFTGVQLPHNGYTEYVPNVGLMIADGSIAPMYIVGVLTEAIANGENGRATTFGKVRNIDTTGTPQGETWAQGDLLWASANTPGALTNIQPTAPDIVISIAAVLKVDATEGEILVRPSIFPQLHFARFYETASQTAAQANTPYAVQFNGTDITCGHITLANSNTEIVCANKGLYDFAFRLHVTSSNAARKRVWIWARINNIDVPLSTTVLTIESNGGIIVPAWSFVYSMNDGDSFQLMWAAEDVAVSILSPQTTGFTPTGKPAVIRITQVNL